MSDHSGCPESDGDERSSSGPGYATGGNPYGFPYGSVLRDSADVLGATHAQCPFSPVKVTRGTPSTHGTSSRLRDEGTLEKVHKYFIKANIQLSICFELFTGSEFQNYL